MFVASTTRKEKVRYSSNRLIYVWLVSSYNMYKGIRFGFQVQQHYMYRNCDDVVIPHKLLLFLIMSRAVVDRRDDRVGHYISGLSVRPSFHLSVRPSHFYGYHFVLNISHRPITIELR